MKFTPRKIFGLVLVLTWILPSFGLAQPRGEYRALRLRSLPTAKERAELESRGIRLHTWLEGTTFWAYVPEGALQDPSLRTRGGGPEETEVRVERKLPPDFSPFSVPEHARVSLGFGAVRLYWLDGIDEASVRTEVVRLGGEVTACVPFLGLLEAQMPLLRIMDLAREPWVRTLDWKRPPEALEDRDQRVQLGAEALSVLENGGLGLEGEGVNVALFDGGHVEAHSDLTGRVFVQERLDHSDHSMHVAGILAGAGVLRPAARGLAPRVKLYTWGFKEEQQGPKNVEKLQRGLEQWNTCISSNSYGFVIKEENCDARMTSWHYMDEELDLMALLNPSLAMVFSNGNYQDACLEADMPMGRGFYTTTRTAKNILTVGATDALDRMTTFSSFGPLVGGRLAPLVCANGMEVLSTAYNDGYELKNGTSMACPAVSGLVALLYEHYRRLNGGMDPHFVLIKSVVMNTCRDLGLPGPDFKFGYGRVDGINAANTLSQRNYQEGRITHGQVEEQLFDIPDGISEARFMLTWHDVASDRHGDDLDLWLEGPDGEIIRPWVLDPSHPERCAVRDVDRLNNQEQVTVSFPRPGPWKAFISATAVSSAVVDYALTWHFARNGLAITFPNGGETLGKGLQIVRWDPGAQTGTAVLSLSIDGGETYSQLSRIADVSKGWAEVDFPGKSLSSKARIRIECGESTDASDANFLLLAPVSGFHFEDVDCEPRGNLKWNEFPGAQGYEVHRLAPGSGEWQKYGETTGASSTSFELKDIDPGQGFSYSVVAVLPDGVVTPRSEALRPMVSRPIELNRAGSSPRIVVPTPDQGLVKIIGAQYSLIRQDASSLRIVPRYTNGQKFHNPEEPFDPKFVVTLAMCVETSGLEDLMVRLPVDLQDTSYARLVAGWSSDEVAPVADIDGRLFRYREDLSQQGACYSLSELLSKRPSSASKLYLAVEAYGVRAGGEGEEKDQVTIQPLIFSDGRVDVSVSELEAVAGSYARFILHNHSNEMKDAQLQLWRNGELLTIQHHTLPPMGVITESSGGRILGIDCKDETVRYELQLKAMVEGDANPENNAQTLVLHPTAGGDCFLMPNLGKGVVRRKVSGGLCFADNGGTSFDYTPGLKGRVIFQNTEDSVVRLRFDEVVLAPGDRLEVGLLITAQAGETEQFEPVYTFDGGSHGASWHHVVVTGRGASHHAPENYSGSLDVRFTPSSASSAAGWRAWVDQVARTSAEVSETNNLLRMDGLSLAGGPAPASETDVVARITNLTSRSVENVEISYRVDNSPLVTELIPEVPAGPGPYVHTFRTKADLSFYPWIYHVQAEIRGGDPITIDNYAQTSVTIDRYPQLEYSSLFPSVRLESVSMNGVEHRYLPEGPAWMSRALLLPVYRDQSENLLTVSVLEPPSPELKRFVWVDWNGNFRFDSDEALQMNGDQVSVGSDHASGRYVLRLAVANQAFDPNQETPAQPLEALINDFTIEVREYRPQAHDVGITDFSRVLNGNQVVLKAEISDFSTVSAGELSLRLFHIFEGREEELTSSVQSLTLGLGDRREVELGSFELSGHGTHVLRLRVESPGDSNPEDNVRELRCFLPEEPVSNYALSFGGNGGHVRLSGWDSELRHATYSCWVFPRTYGGETFARIFDGKGTSLFMNPMQTHNSYAYGALVVSTFKGIFCTPGKVLDLGRWQHVVVVVGDADPKLFVDGRAVVLKRTSSGSGASPAKDLPLYLGNSPNLDRPFDGMLDGFRVRDEEMSPEEAQADRFALARTDAAQLLDLRFGEGPFSRRLSNSVPGSQISGELVDMAVNQLAGGAWREAPSLEFTHFQIPGQVHESWFQRGEELRNETSGDRTGLTLSYELSVAGAELVIDGSSHPDSGTIENLDLSQVKEVTIRVNWSGVELSRKVRIVLSELAGPGECEISRLESPSLGTQATIEGNTILLPLGPGPVDLSSLKVEFELSPGARLLALGREIASGEELDLRQPLRIMVTNGEMSRTYILRLQAAPIKWASATLSSGYQIPSLELDAQSDGCEVYYVSSDVAVARPCGAQLMLMGVGTAEITAHTRATDALAPAVPVKRSVTVSPAPLTVRPRRLRIDQTDPMPHFDLEYSGFRPGEGPAVLDELPVVKPSSQTTDAPGEITLSLEGGKAANYNLNLQLGVLEVSAVPVRQITFRLRSKGQPLPGARISIRGGYAPLTTDADGETGLKLKEASYSFTVEAQGLAPYEEDFTVSGEDKVLEVDLSPKPIDLQVKCFPPDGGRVVVKTSSGIIQPGPGAIEPGASLSFEVIADKKFHSTPMIGFGGEEPVSVFGASPCGEGSYCVDTDPYPPSRVVVAACFQWITLLEFGDHEGGQIIVSRQGLTLSEGDTLHEGDLLKVTLVPEKGFKKSTKAKRLRVEGADRVTGTADTLFQVKKRASVVRFYGGFEKRGSSVGLDVLAGVTISPNPTRGMLRLENMVGVQMIEVFDVMGHRLLARAHDGSDQIQLDLSSLREGVYLLRMTLPRGQITLNVAKLR